MGCFNTTGFHSNLPIVCGDKIFSIICLRWNEFDDDFLRFGPGYQITPIFLPIFGEYNDYGNIENIERTPEVESIERMFGYNIDDIMEAIQNIMWGHDDIGKNRTICKHRQPWQPSAGRSGGRYWSGHCRQTADQGSAWPYPRHWPPDPSTCYS